MIIRTKKGYHKKNYCRADKKFINGHSMRGCLKCRALYMREFRSSHKMTDEQKMKDNCRSYASVYLKRGKIKKGPCAICRDKNSEMHHSDYSKPLVILWLCRKCHLKFHKDQEKYLKR